MSDDGFPKPCEVLVEGQWLPATLMRWYHWPDGSLRGAVAFRRLMTLDQLNSPFGGTGDVPFWFNFEQTRRPAEVRPPSEGLPPATGAHDGVDAEVVGQELTPGG